MPFAVLPAFSPLQTALALALGLLVKLMMLGELDRRVSRRHMVSQLRAPLSFVFSPFNALVHLGSTPEVKHALARSAIIQPVPDSMFPHASVLRANWRTIRDEALAVQPTAGPIKGDFFFMRIADAGWRRFYIKWYGPPDAQARRRCPQTCRLLKDMPEVHLAMFSILGPGSRIKPHFGPFKGSLRYHLALQAPGDARCHIRIGGDTHVWRAGEDVLFDDTFEHEVVNDSDETRIVLFCDVKRPQSGWLANAYTDFLLEHVAPLTTRANDKQEKAVASGPRL